MIQNHDDVYKYAAERGRIRKQISIAAAQDERRRLYNAYIQEMKKLEASNRVETPAVETPTTVKADTLLPNNTSSSEPAAETQTRNNKPAEKKSTDKKVDNKGKQRPKKNILDEISKWTPSWHVPKQHDYAKFAEENRRQMDLNYNNLISLAEGPTTNVTSKAMLDQAVAEEKRLLDSDYTKRKRLLEQQRRDAINSQAANASNPSVSEQYSREADRITKKLETLDQEYLAANERLASGIDRGTIAMKSWQKLSDSLTRDLYAQLNTQRAQYNQLDKNPNADSASKQKLQEQNDRLVKKINALESKAGLLDKWIRKNGIPKDLNQLPQELRGIAEQIVRNGGTLDTGFRTPQQVKEEGERVRKSAFDQKGSTVETNVNSDLMVDYRDKLIAQARMIEDKHGISRAYADFENTDSDDGVTGHLLHAVRSTPLGWINTGAYQLRLGEDREQYNQIVEAIHSIDKALKYKDINDSFYKTSDFNRYWWKNEAANIAKSFWNNAIDTSIWDFGASDLSKSMMINSIREAQDNGDRFTVAQRDMLNAMAIDAVMHDKYSEYEDAWGVRAGSTFAQSLPFMLDMMIGSHGLASAAKAGEKTAVAKVAKFLTGETGKAMQRQALREAIEQYGVRGVEAAMARNIKQIPGLLTRLSGDAANALLLANTVQGAKTASDILNLHNGLVDYKINEDGSITGIGLKQGLEWGEAIRQAETRAWIENFSEALGEYDIFTNMFKPLTRKLVKANYALKTGKQLSDIAGVDIVAKNLLRGGKAIKEVFDAVNKYNPFAGGKMRDFLHAARYHGAIGESLEEYYGMALEHAMGVSDSGKSFWEDLVSKDNFWDIVGGIALSQAFLGSAGGIHVLSSRNRYKYAQSRAARLFGDSWKPMEDAIINASSENIARVVNSMAAATKSIEDKQALFDYYTELMSYRGASYAEQQAQDARNSSNHAKAVRDSYETGYMVSTQNARNDMDRAIEGVRQNLNQAFGVEDIDQAIEDNGGVDELASRLDDNQLRNVLVAYDNMLATRDGMTQRQNDDLEIMLLQATDDVMHLRYRDGSNKIVAAQLKNGQTVFITNGLHDDYQSGKILATGFNGQRFELDRDQIAEDEKGREIIDEYDVQSFINSQQQKILEDYLITDENRNQRNPEVKTGTVVRLQDNGILTVLGTARDGGVLYSIREYNNDKRTSVKETTLKAESTAQMAEIIKDANADRLNAIAVKFLENAAKENSKQPSIPAEQPVVDDEVAQELADQMNLRVEEALRKPTDFIPSGRRGTSEADDKGFIPNRGNALKTYNSAINAVKHASTAKDYTEFTQKLEQAGFAVPFQYGGRLQTLYKAYQAGQISDKELALVFVPNEERKNVAGKKVAKRFENLEFDSEGNIISSRRPKMAPNKPVESTSPAEPAVVPPAEKNTISRADLDESDTMTKFVADWIDQDPNGGQATVVSSDGKIATIEYYTEDSNGEKTKRTTSVRLKQNSDGTITPEVPTESPVEEKQPKKPYIKPTTTITAKPAPESTNAGTVEAVDQVLQNNPQLAAIDALMSKIEADKAAVRIDLRTGHDYFIEVDGKLVMYPRVHSILDPQYPDRSTKINNKQTFLNKLAAARSSKKDWEELARLLAKQHNERYPNEEPVSVEVYIKYAQDNPNEIAAVEEAIADLCSNEDTHVSVKYGNIIDRLCRDFFGNKLMGYWQYKDVMDEELYYKILQQLDAIRQIYIARGWKLITEPVYLHSELQDAQGNTVRVAGETDMIAVDKDGNYHIIDFKTSYGKFVPVILGDSGKGYAYDRFSEVFPTIESLSPEPRTAKRTYRLQYSNQLTMYSVMAEDNLDRSIKSISLLPWRLSYESNSPSVWLDDATNFESAVNQEGTDYIRDSENKPILKPVLLELDKTSDVLNRFTPPTQAEPEKTQAANAVAHGEISAMSDALAEDADSITDDVKNAAVKLVEAQDAVVEGALNTGDTKAHENAQKQSEQSAAAAQELQLIAEQLATEAAQAELNAKAAETKAEQQKQEVVQDWTQHTTTHTHTLDNSIGIEEATAIDDASKKLKYVTGEPDFIANSRFIFGVTNINGQEKLTVLVVYKGVTYQPVTISTANNPLGRKFYGKVRLALRKANSNQVVVATSVKRTGGRMHAGIAHLMTEASPGLTALVSTKRGEGEVYLYDVQLGPQFGRVVELGNMYAIVIPGTNGGQNQTVYMFNNNVEALAGTYAMVLNRHFSENEKQAVPISMHHAKMTEGDADLIIDILNGNHSANGAKMQAALSQHFVDGNVDYGMTNLQVLNLLIQIGQPLGSSRLHLEFDTMSQDVVRIVGPVNGSNITDRVFYLNTDTGRNAFKEFLTENVTKQLSDTIMYHRLGKNTTSATQPFHGILDFVRTASGQQILQLKGQIQFGKSSIIFDLADFKDPENPNDKLGLTGLGWYMKRGFIQTLFDGIDDTLLDFDNTADVRIEDDNLPPAPPVQQVANNPVEIGVVEATSEMRVDQLPDTFDYDQNDWDVEGFDKRISRHEKTSGTIKEDEARKNLEKIFGENSVKIEFVDNVIAMMRRGARVVGRCYADSIILSRRADAGVEYHEAFHRVVELLLTEKLRAKVYAAFRNAKKGRKNLTDRLIAEALADNFMYFMQNRPAFKFTFNLKKMFTQIFDWVKMLHDIGSFRLTYLYLVTANGRFRNVQPTAEAQARFKAFAKHGLNFTKRGTDLQHTLNEHHYRTLVKSLTYMFMNPATQKIEWTGANISELKIDKETAMKSQIWKQWMEPMGMKDGKPVYRVPYETRAALQEMMDNWDAVQPDVASKIAQFSTDFKVKYEDANHTQLDTAVPDVQNELDVEGNLNDDDPASAGAEATDGHIKASYEFNPFSRASEKVKFFFAGIPDYTFDANGRKRPMLNECGLPQLMSATQVYARMLNDMHTIKDVNELRRELARLGQNDYMYATISRRFEQLYQAIIPEKGKEVDYDAEQLIAQITQTVRQNKNVFEIAKTRKTDEGFTVDIIPSDSGYTARKFTEDWSQQFAAGAGLFIKQNERGEYVMKQGLTPWVFTTVYRMYAGNNNQGGMILALSPTNQNPTPFNLNGVEIDINNPEHIDMCKHQIVRTLRWFGINFEKEALDYTLVHEYGGKGANELYSFLTDTRFGGFNSFLNLISKLNYNGTLNIEGNTIPFLYKRNGDPVQVDEVFSYNGFVKSLASRKYAYRHSFDQMSVLATNNKQFYEMSENNFLTDRLFELLTDPNLLASAKADPYIYFEEEQVVGENTKYGSLVVEHIAEVGSPLEIATLIGFSSYEAGADDVDYAQMSAREDYISKFSALLSGRMIFPTQSDKKTWGYVKGLMLPGLNFNNLAETMPTKKGRIVSDAVLDRLIAYAKTEDAAISRFLEEHDSIPEEQRVENYDEGSEVEETLATGEKVKHHVLLGGRYSALLGIWDGDTFVEFNRLFDENGVYLDERMCQQRAHEYFFSKSPEEQRDMMNTILLKQTELELEYICELGLINGVPKQNADDSNMLAYKNVGLDYRKVDAVYNLLAATYPNGNQEIFRRTALMMVVGDVVAKGIVSMNEYERVFCGQPSFFKFKYDEAGHLINRTDDQSKRLGGLVSTGFNNVMLPGISEEYTCAEVQDEKVSQDNIEEIHKMMHEGTVRQTYLRNKLEEKAISFEDVQAAKEVADQVDAMKIEDIEATFDDTVKAIINQSVDAKVKAFKKINVTDGASYISEQMCENLLRMAGSFSGDVKRAFDILTGKKVDGKVYTTKDIRELADAYQIVLTSVIGAQKYTAYGFREREFVDGGGNRTITHIPYYNKTALFPIFKSIATGPLADFYQKMQDNKIDMIMMHSAVKVGGQGAVPVKWDDLDSLKFNTYVLKVKYLRKQFNTDPKEKEEMSMGTQTKKVALSTLTPGRTYSVGNETLSATEVRDRIMDSLNSMSDIGEQTIKDMFFTEGQFDVQKFSDLLTKELVGRGASAEMIDAVSVENGQLKLPLAALSGMNWIQSIIKSMIDKRVLDTNTPGKAFYQRSVWGMEGQSILSDDNIPPTINGGKKLQVNNEDNSMDIVLSIDYFEDILKKAKVKSGRKVKKTRKVKRNQYVTYEKYGQPITDYTKTQEVEVDEEYEADEYVSVSTLSFEQQKKWLEDHNIIGHNAKANIIGYRIPTQAVSSIHAMRCVDVLPVVRDTIIMPAAITSITGSDFDIDKFFLSRLYINSNGSTEFKEDTHEWHANRLINAYLAVLKDSPNSFQDLNGSIDNDTSLLTDVRDDLREGQKTKTLIPYSAYTLRSQSATKNVFIAGKFGIGPFALNNNMHILMQLYGVKFAEGENIMSDLGLTKLGGFTDRYGRSILSWFSGLINAHVDAAKDPWIPELNVNKYTYNLVSVLMHSGLGKDTFYFTTQPIMRQLAIAYENASGVYMSDQSKSKSKVQQEAEEEVIKNMIDAHWNKQLLEDGVATEQTFSFSSYNAAVKAYWKTKGYTPQEAIKALFEKDCQVMRQLAKKHIGEPGSLFLSVEDDQTSYWLTINGEEYNLTAFDVQMIVAAANSELKPYAEALSKLVQHTKIDTKKQGKNLIEQRKYLQGMSDLFDSTQMADDRLLFDTETLDRLYTDSYILHQTKLATDLFRQIMANLMIEATDKFVTDVDRVLKTIGNPGTDPKVLNAVQKGIMAKIKSKFFFGQGGYCERHKIDPRSLVAGKNTIYDKLLTIKAVLMNDPKYKDMLDRRSGEPSNYLLRALVSGNKYRRFDEKVSYSIGTSPDTFMDAKFIQTLGFVTDEAFNADDLSQAWDDLLRDSKYPELQQFARELVVYAFITSGDNGGNYDLFKYVPNTWRLGQTEEGASYADHIAQQHAKYVDGVDVLDENDFEDIILNMWQDDNIVPKYSMYRKNFKLFESWDTDNSAAGLPVVMGAVDKKGQPTIRRDKAYIKVPRLNNGAEVKGQRGYVVYKRIGYGTSKANQLYPIYAMIDPRGEVFDKNERIFQHWQEDYSETRNIVEKYLGQILKAAELLATTVEDAVTKIADYILANKLDLQTIVEGGLLDEDLSYIIKDINRTSSTVAQNDQPLPVQTVNFYEGLIVPDGSTVFVFGSNPGGVHGTGAAKTARDMFGAQTGVGEGMTGNAYALPTKDLEASKGTEWYKPGEEQRDKILQYYKQLLSMVVFDPSNISYLEVVDNPIKRTIAPEKIVESIKRMYEVARQNPEKQFKVAYSNGLTEITYNGYIGAEMIEMFKEAGPIPSNVLFSRAWVSSGMFDQTIQQPETKAPGTYDMPFQSNQLEVNGVRFIESTGGYRDRTIENITNTDVTLAFVIDETSLGERLTENQARKQNKYQQQLLTKRSLSTENKTDIKRQVSNQIHSMLSDQAWEHKGTVLPTKDIKLNIAGNGIYTFVKDSITQEQLNDYVTEYIREMIAQGVTISEIRSGGLTGIDEAGIVAALRLGIPAIVNAPHRFLFRNENNQDVADRDKFISRFNQSQQEERKPRLIERGNTEYENVYQNMTDSEYEEWKKNQGETHKMQAVGRNPYKIQLELKQIILSTDVSDAFDKYLQKSRNNYPKEFYDNEKRVKYVKSNNHKHSRLYDVVDIETGEIIAQKLPLFTKDLWERQQESRKKLDELFTNYNQSRSFAFKKSISTPSKGLFKKMAKQYLLEAIRAQSDVSESVINHKIIDDFVDQFNDTVWEHVITYALDPTHGPGREDSAYDARLFGMATTDPRELRRFAFNPTIPKQGLIDEVCKALNLDKDTLTFTGYVKGEYYKKQKVNRNLPYDVLQEMLELIAEGEDKRVEMELIHAYAESTGETVQQIQDRINRLREEGTIEASKEILRILHGTSATNIVLRTQENYSKQYRQWLDEKGIVVPNNIVRIIFNRHSFAADDTPIVRLATIMHEPFHALEMLHYGTEALDKVQHAFDVFLQTEYGKQIFEDYKKHNNEITGYKEGDLPSEFLADLFSLMMMPPLLRAQYTAAEDRILGARLAKTLNDLLNSPDFKTIITVEPKAVIESFTEQQRIILPLLKQIYNAIIKWLSEYSTFVKNTFKLYDEFVTVTSYRRNDTFEKVEQVNKFGVSFEEALNTLSEAMVRLSLEDVVAGQSVPASTMFMQSDQYSDYIESQSYLDDLKSLGEEQERKCKGE